MLKVKMWIFKSIFLVNVNLVNTQILSKLNPQCVMK